MLMLILFKQVNRHCVIQQTLAKYVPGMDSINMNKK